MCTRSARRAHLLLVLMTAIALGGARAAAADTVVVGGNVVDQTWSPAGSPYLVQGDITIPAGATLRILAGTAVRFADGDSMGGGSDPARTEVSVRGTLRIEGTAAAPVTLDASSGAARAWYGLIIAGDAPLAHLRHLEIRHAEVAISYYGAGPSLDLASARIEGGGGSTGIHAAGVLTADAVELRDHHVGVFIPIGGSATLTNSVLRDDHYGAYNLGTLTLDHCTVYSNTAVGVYAVDSGVGTTIVRNSIVAGPGQNVGVNGTNRVVSLLHSNIWGNQSNVVGVQGGDAVTASDPLFVSPDDLRLTSNSPSRFADAAGGDQGARPYDGVATDGLRGTLWASTELGAATHHVSGDLTVAPGRTLTLAAGAVLQFADRDSMGGGADPERAELWVRGTLRVEGTAASPVTLEATSGAAMAWYGLHIASDATLAYLRHLVIRHAVTGIGYYGAGPSLDLAFARIEGASASTGIHAAGAVTADAVEIRGGFFGVFVPIGGSATLTNAIVRDARYGAYSVGALTLDHCTVYSNTAVGVYAVDSGVGATIVRNSIVAGPGQNVGVNGTNRLVYLLHSNIWGNQSNVVGVQGGDALISIDPLFVSPADLQLQPSSACVDAATGGVTHDIVGTPRPLDGDRIGPVAPDMGAYELIPVPVCGDGAIEPGEACDDGAANGSYEHCRADCGGPGPSCGDGAVDGPEECDDGNGSDNDACLGTCRLATCGDGIVQVGVELCDDGNDSSSDACVSCQLATCGDGVVWVGAEQCDDGNDANDDACVGSCQLATCGDGYQWTGAELCDDGNDANDDACVGACVPAACGDGFVRTGVEACDDGNDVNDDACVGSCQLATCGDAFVRAGVEDCDDGNAANTDACLTTCVDASCGDAFVHAGVEDCDDGNTSDTDACLTSCLGASCGDGHLQDGVEDCDDGNVVGTDGCTNACTVARCGDGVVRSGLEDCDDGNTSNTDACVAGCHTAACGDGYLRDGVEACDDGNTDNDDACSAVCALPSCGNGTVEGTEACDDGNASNDDGCLVTCAAATCGDGHVRVGIEACDDGNDDDSDGCLGCAAARCGDGVVHDGVEECDDGNDVDGDACRVSCARAVCGDGVVHDGEETCDDGNGDDDDACRNDCRSARCGDGVVQAGVEACDDGNDVDTDACPTTCLAARCGDGIVHDGVEACDDGNGVDGDGCSAQCLVEVAMPPDAGVPDAGSPGPDAGAPDADAGMEPPADGSCSTGGGGMPGAGLVILAALLARHRRAAR
jgi:cysteine-rich repeat protein